MSVMTNQEFAQIWSAKMHIAKADKKMRQIESELEQWFWELSPVVFWSFKCSISTTHVKGSNVMSEFEENTIESEIMAEIEESLEFHSFLAAL